MHMDLNIFWTNSKKKSGENIIVTRRNGKPDMVTFRAIAQMLLYGYQISQKTIGKKNVWLW